MSDTPPKIKPTALPVIAENIPAELRNRGQWVCWSYTWNPGKTRKDGSGEKGEWDKPPLNPRDLSNAKANDASTWGSFDEAIARYYAGEVDGIGFVPVDDEAEEVLVFGDFDKMRDPETGELTPWASGWVKALDTYTEASPSGTGVRPIGWGRLPLAGRKRGQVEVYQHHHYLTITGQRLDGVPATIERRGEQFLNLHCHVWPEHHQDGGHTNGEQAPAVDIGDEELIRRMFASKYGSLIKHLWDGGNDEFPSDSEGDWHFCLRVGWWVRWDKERLDQFYRKSGRMREKWNRKDYREKTLRACDGKSGGYEQRPPVNVRSLRVASTDSRESVDSDEVPAFPFISVIKDDFLERYDPIFRDGTAIWSNKLRRLVKASEATFAPDTKLLTKLSAAPGAPTDKKGQTDVDVLIKAFWSSAKVAWREILDSLPDEEEQREGTVESAEHKFRRLVAACLFMQATFTVQVKKNVKVFGKDAQKEEAIPERRSLLQWAEMWAKPGRWAQVRSALLWCRQSLQGVVELALRAELFNQYGPRELAEMPVATFARLAKLYGVGAASDEDRPGGKRAVILDADFLASLREGPDLPEEVAGETPARAHEEKTAAVPATWGISDEY